MHTHQHLTATRPRRARTHRCALAAAIALVATACASKNADEIGAAESTGAEATLVSSEYALSKFPSPPSGFLSQSEVTALQAVLDAAVAERLPGVTATVMVAGRGTWSGASGTADGVHPMTPLSQFGIGSITKTVVAAEVMRLVEQGELSLDDPVEDHLPDSLEFDTNATSIRDLLAMESGIPNASGLDSRTIESDPMREWQAREILAFVPTRRAEPGARFDYSNTNYVLLGLVIEEVTGVSVAVVLRAHLTTDERLASLVYQPAERPAGPLALPFVGNKLRPDIVELGGGYLPSKASASASPGDGGMASDSAALALWGYLLFGGQLISTESVRAMTEFGDDGYGLGVFDMSRNVDIGDVVVGNGGRDDGGYAASLVAVPSRGIVISVLTNLGGHPDVLTFPVVEQLAAVLTG